MKRLNALLEEYNATCSQLGVSHYSFQDVVSPDSDFWSVPTTTEDSIPWSLKRNISQAFLLLKRTEEELCLLKEEMQHVLHYWEVQKDKITAALVVYSDNDGSNRGARALLHKLLWEAELNLARASATFSPILINSSIPDSDSESDDSLDSSDDESYLI